MASMPTHLYWHGGSWNLPLHQHLLWATPGGVASVGTASAFLVPIPTHREWLLLMGALVHRMKLAAVNVC